MKTQRRHELQTNELADYIGKHLQQIKPYYTQIAVGAVIIAILGLGGVYHMARQRMRSGASWSDYFGAFGARDVKGLEEVGTLHNGTTAALWAQQSAGDIKLATGDGDLYRDRDEAKNSLKDAEKLFLAVEAGAAGDPMLLQRARLGLAQVYESLFKVEKAEEYYEKVARSSPDSAIGKMAQRRAKQLSAPSAQRWYAWFERQEPVVPGHATGGAGAEPPVSNDLDALPDRPNLAFPGSDIADELKNMKPEPGKPDGTPMDEPADEGNAESKSSSETEEQKPADDTAAESKAKPEPDASKPEPKESNSEPDKPKPQAEEPKPEPEEPKAEAEEAKPVPAESKEEAGENADEPASKPDSDSAKPDKQP